MSVKPILFSTEMVRAILDGRKTVTRRVIKKDIINQCDIDTDGTIIAYCDGDGDWHDIKAMSRYQPDDILYVRETFFKGKNRILYKANYSENEKFYTDGKEIQVKWKPSIHMPKEAARIWLKVTELRVERIKDITEDEAHREGFQSRKDFIGAKLKMHPDCTEDSWVWVIELEKAEKPKEWLKHE